MVITTLEPGDFTLCRIENGSELRLTNAKAHSELSKVHFQEVCIDVGLDRLAFFRRELSHLLF